MEIPKPEDVEGLGNWGYPKLQKLAELVEKKHGVNIDRGAKKPDLVKAIKTVILQHAHEYEASEEKPEEKPAEKVAEKPAKKPKAGKSEKVLYKAIVRYKDMESGWSFNPKTDTEPKAIEKKTAGIKNAINDGKIIPVVVGE